MLGYPAYAGIDLLNDRIYPLDAGLPRIRGDRPGTPVTTFTLAVATPHTRGSTRPKTPEGQNQNGYPAYAGIDPDPGTNETRRDWLPRIRGDRPFSHSIHTPPNQATPHTRGSTLLHRDPNRRVEGSPAYAGIDHCWL